MKIKKFLMFSHLVKKHRRTCITSFIFAKQNCPFPNFSFCTNLIIYNKFHSSKEQCNSEEVVIKECEKKIYLTNVKVNDTVCDNDYEIGSSSSSSNSCREDLYDQNVLLHNLQRNKKKNEEQTFECTKLYKYYENKTCNKNNQLLTIKVESTKIDNTSTYNNINQSNNSIGEQRSNYSYTSKVGDVEKNIIMKDKETFSPVAITAVDHITCDTNSIHRDKLENTEIRTYLNSYLNNNNSSNNNNNNNSSNNNSSNNNSSNNNNINNNDRDRYNNRNEPNRRNDLNDELEALEVSLRPSPTDITNIKKFLSFLQNEINKYYKNCYVTPFGSIINGFWMKCSDIDICIQIPLLVNRKDQITFLKKICYILNNYNGGIIEQRFSAKIPIVHFACNDLQSYFKLSCDISINNILAVVNSKLIQKYVSIDRRLQILGIAIKYWAKCRNINDRSKGFLSSFSLILMIIHFLQSVIEPKILPSLQDISVKRNDQSVYIMGIDCKYCQDMNIIREELEKLNSDSGFTKSDSSKKSKYVDTSTLLIDFFKFYGYKYKSGIIAIRDINAYYDNFQASKNYDSYFFFVDNPFEVGKNVANILPQNYKIIINEMKRAYKILKNNGTWKDVCSVNDGLVCY
ncbi:conserved protein, unknown function [Hepatocystis sp. ex Piliocolobus tephrosceles]|nr:conserved protein, unknown function [Hepatocystis sp. ex Piliocolobus tephrosceles]